MKFLTSLSKRPPSHQLLWVYLIGEVESNNHLFEPRALCIKFDMSNSTLKRAVAWGIAELNQERVVYRAYWKDTMLNIALGDVGVVKKVRVKETEEPKKEPKETQTKTELIDIIDYLNEKTGRGFKANSKIAQRCIDARLSEGYKLNDFKKVVDIKTQKWMGTSMEQFCRPETLFGNKFDSYLNETLIQNEQQSRFVTTQRAVDEAKGFDFFSNQG
jgi:uncharacterized phage protein (TIGR02220 family)